jgi:hypothetical protein
METHRSYIWCHQEPTRSTGTRQGIHDTTSQRMCCGKWSALWTSYVILKQVPAHECKSISRNLSTFGPMLLGTFFCLSGGGEYPGKVCDVGFETFCIYTSGSNINRPQSTVTSERKWSKRSLVWWCGQEWGPLLLCRLPLPFFRSFARTMNEKEVPATVAQHIIIKFLVKENVGPTEIWTRLYSQYVELTLSKTQVKVWHRKFWKGREAVENTSHQRRPWTSINSSNVAAVRKLIEDNCCLTIIQIS